MEVLQERMDKLKQRNGQITSTQKITPKKSQKVCVFQTEKFH